MREAKPRAMGATPLCILSRSLGEFLDPSASILHTTTRRACGAHAHETSTLGANFVNRMAYGPC